MKIYHIVTPEVWDKFRDENFYEAASLHTENFIHCSYAAQLDAVSRRYYKDADEVLILEIEPEKLTSELIAEPSTGGEIYPHIYGRINKDAIVKIETRNLRDAG